MGFLTWIGQLHVMFCIIYYKVIYIHTYIYSLPVSIRCSSQIVAAGILSQTTWIIRMDESDPHARTHVVLAKSTTHSDEEMKNNTHKSHGSTANKLNRFTCLELHYTRAQGHRTAATRAAIAYRVFGLMNGVILLVHHLYSESSHFCFV
ncbi:hypothetical protein GQ55_7G119900 [Panicum hallii var. hallii]|uniref:Uncharacterized protein n=1 Tax=Panicum hallii var. hallii TaxID=1504633 RepID=A0A2T7CU76_9POAL|nr:hypothetical protein GQ55_7G119900 [Panicum hallii var. hallii]